MEEKRIEIVKSWPEFQLVQNLQVFLGLVNFYQRFIKSFSKVATLFTFMLKTILQSLFSTSDFDIVNLSSAEIARSGGVGGVNKKVKNLSKAKNTKKLTKSNNNNILAKSKKSIKSIANQASRADFLIPKAKVMFTYLRQVFTKVLILNYFNPKCHIQNEIDASGYAIDRIFSYITQFNYTSIM